MKPNNMRYWVKLVVWLLLTIIGVQILLELNNLGDAATLTLQPRRKAAAGKATLTEAARDGANSSGFFLIQPYPSKTIKTDTHPNPMVECLNV